MTAATQNTPLLEVKNLTVSFAFRGLEFDAVRDVSFSLGRGDRLGLVGESGAGKSVTGFSIINLISKPGFIREGQVLFEGNDLTKLSDSAMRGIRGNRISMIFQDPMMTLNPVLTIGTQMVETLQAHRNISKKEAEAIALEKLRQVYIPSPEKRLAQYPHEFSGGMRQRIVIAIALLSDPALIIADEPTTALDVTIQAEIMELLLDLCEKFHMSLILITHDLAVVSQVTKRIAVMYAGRIVETGETERIVSEPAHPYTRGLLAALPGVGGARRSRLSQIPGLMPSIKNMPEGCAFHPRCSDCSEVCGASIPLLSPAPHGGYFACHMEQPCKDPRPDERELMRDRGAPE
ncbi:ABC transporter ATP-binding protein [Oceanidesulfovibrio marinus]|uniref:ABC transporter ATP-binding protein n=1 Tax=Oceanidesulfovibrio marinus TaxID=370038 RepID=A0A6P1ZCY3_9BACT|nr:ABC transporter ATP-binding protein [Oceanidesulfovibrio marinus]QJT09668.1 ABC transporter ATP-binding protein [Oceanidesulfovibrio marinus]TVM31029.1 methionine ABC transporter ATP-binding protein [Oceanidesulfovibrio marinus]